MTNHRIFNGNYTLSRLFSTLFKERTVVGLSKGPSINDPFGMYYQLTLEIGYANPIILNIPASEVPENQQEWFLIEYVKEHHPELFI